MHNFACMGTRCSGEGGGANLSGGDATVRNNRFISNTASLQAYGYGGGLELQGSRNVLNGNLFQGNVATSQGNGYGGGLALSWVYHTALDANVFLSNTATLSPTATGIGGGLDIAYSQAFTFTNNLLAANQANTASGGFAYQSNPWHPGDAIWVHTTIADNHAPSGVFISTYNTLVFSNTILSGHPLGISVTTGSTVTFAATLWHNDTDWGSGGTILTGTHNLWGDPRFVAPDVGNYHLRADSPAIDVGLDVGVAADMDGESRPQGALPDLGADEFWPRLYLPLVMKP